MRILAGIVIALALALAALLYAVLASQELPPSPIAELETPAPSSPAAQPETPDPSPKPEPDTQATKEPLAQEAEPATKQAREQLRDPIFEPVRRDVRDVTPDHVLPAPDLDAALIERLPAIVPPAPPPRPPEPERWRRAQVVAPGIFRSGDKRIVIAGIEPLPADAECRTDKGEDWPCGNYASAALKRLVRQRPIECDPADARDGDGGIVTICRIAGRDIGEWMVDQGWARPLDGSGYDAAFSDAREAGRGQFRKELGRKPSEANIPVGAVTSEVVTGSAPLLAPGLTATDALVPLIEPTTPAQESETPAPDSLPAAPAERGGLDQ